MKSNVGVKPRLEVTGLAKTYPPATHALRGVDLEIHPGEVHGLLGANGAGKSTLIKILTGVEQADRGEISIDGAGPLHFESPVESYRAGIGVVHQELPFFKTLSAADNMVIGTESGGFLTPANKRAVVAGYERSVAGFHGAPAAREILEKVGIDGWQIVAIARAISHGARLLILDEPTSSLKPAQRKSLHEAVARIADDGAAVVYVSHFLKDVLEVCDRVTVLRDGDVVLRGRVGGLTTVDLLTAMTGEEMAATEEHGGQTVRGGEVALQLSGFSVQGSEAEIDLRVAAGECVGLYGLAGCGAPEVIRGVYGLLRYQGDVRLAGCELRGGVRERLAAGLGFVSGDRRAGLIGDWTVADNVDLPRLARTPLWRRGGNGRGRRTASTAVEKLAIKGGVGHPVNRLSGGNQQKVAMGRWIDSSLSCLLADDPTRGIDAGGRLAIHRAISELTARGCALIHSSDPEEMVSLCDRVLVLDEGRVVDELEGDRLTIASIEGATRIGGQLV